MGAIFDFLPDISFIDDTTFDDVREEMKTDFINEYSKLTGKNIDTSLASPYMSIINAAAVQIYQIMQFADYSAKMGRIKYSSGAHLDNLVAFKGIEREREKNARTVIEFKIANPNPNIISIPKGTRVTDGNENFFASDEYAEIKVGNTAVQVPATCTVKGTSGNNIVVGGLNILVNTIPFISSVKNIVKTAGGSEIESDDELRQRFFAISDSYTTAGSDGAYRYFAKKASDEVEDVIVNSKSDAMVEITISKKGGGIPDGELIKKVSDYLRDENIRPLTDKVVVKAPGQTSYTVNITYYVSAENKASVEDIKSKVEEAVKEYNKWQTAKIGRDINPSALIRNVMQAGAKRVDVVNPVFTKMASDHIAITGNVSATYGGLEDD